MKSSLSLGSRDPEYIRHSIVAGIGKSIVQGLRRIPSGDVMSAGDMRLNGGEFLFEAEGGDRAALPEATGQAGFKSVEVNWHHVMDNTRDHVEISDLRRVLKIPEGNGIFRRPFRRHWSAAGITRSISLRRRDPTERTASRSVSRPRAVRCDSAYCSAPQVTNAEPTALLPGR